VSWYDDLEDEELEKFNMFLKKIAVREEKDVRVVLREYKDNFNEYINKQ
jgi:hypothetical protein